MPVKMSRINTSQEPVHVDQIKIFYPSMLEQRKISVIISSEKDKIVQKPIFILKSQIAAGKDAIKIGHAKGVHSLKVQRIEM